ncbi:hypothetical protein, partial [Actinomadura sp. NPDC000929]|uniref:hypothetical protein n=1 Tax=Actinomadura sp. NPDC000929 TaxID=3154517 RepID=UPI003392BA5C
MPGQRRGPAGVRRALTLITVPVTAASLAAAPALAGAPAGAAGRVRHLGGQHGDGVALVLVR